MVDKITKSCVAHTIPLTAIPDANTAIPDANPGTSTVDKLTVADTHVDVTSTELLVIPAQLFTSSLDATPGPGHNSNLPGYSR
jgi:hypothetical protein